MTALTNTEFVSGTTITSTWLNGVNDALNNVVSDTSGTTARTLTNKITEFISVKDFGAVGDGVTDDTVAIQAAITAAAVSMGTVRFYATTYLISDSLTIPSGVSLVGVGSGQYPTVPNVESSNFTALKKTRLKASGSFPSGKALILVTTSSNAAYTIQSVKIEGIIIDCANVAQYGLNIVSVKNSQFIDLFVFRPTVRGIIEDVLPTTATGTAQAGAASTITLATSASTRDNWYSGLTISITAGTGNGQSRTISSYVGSTQVATVSVNWGTNPDSTSQYSITGTAPTETNAANQFNSYHNITIWAADIGSTAVGWIQQGDTLTNTNQNVYENIKIVHRDGDALQIWNADANVITNINTYSFGTGVGIRLKGNNKNSVEFARNNTINWCQLAGSGTGGLVAESGSTISSRNCARTYSTGNGAAQPTIQSGASFWYDTDWFFPYTWQTFTPTITFSTPGDLSVSYTVQNGRFWKQGSVIHFQVSLSFTPTYTTASGQLRIAGLPFTAGSLSTGYQVTAVNSGTGLTYPASCTTITGRVMNGTTYAQLVGSGSGAATAFLSTTQCSSGGSYIIQLGGSYESTT